MVAETDLVERARALAAQAGPRGAEIEALIQCYIRAAKIAWDVGADFVDIKHCHGYLLHEFLSPIANQRSDHYGGSFENRIRLTLEVTDAVRAVWPAELPLLVRISATDWAEGGWTVDESVQLATQLRARGVDLIDCSSGGLASHQKITIGPGYQVPFARRIRAEADMPTAAVGLITDAAQAEQIVADGSADMVFPSFAAPLLAKGSPSLSSSSLFITKMTSNAIASERSTAAIIWCFRR